MKVWNVKLPTGQVVKVKDYGDGKLVAGGGGFEGTAEYMANATGAAMAVEMVRNQQKAEKQKSRNTANAKKIRPPFSYKSEWIDTQPQLDKVVAEFIELAEDDAYMLREAVYDQGVNQRIIALMKKHDIPMTVKRLKDSKARLKKAV